MALNSEELRVTALDKWKIARPVKSTVASEINLWMVTTKILIGLPKWLSQAPEASDRMNNAPAVINPGVKMVIGDTAFGNYRFER